MARTRRLFVPGLSVHVIQRGNNGTSIFRDDLDRHLFLKYVRKSALANGLQVHGFVLMTTHWHGLVTPGTAEALPETMKKVGERYVRYFNRKYDRFGTLWAERYRQLWIPDEIYWLTCLRYIEQNPVRAKMVPSAGDYRWSSYRAHAYGDADEWLSSHPVYEALGRNVRDRRLTYRALCGASLTESELAVQRHPAPMSVSAVGGDAVELAVAT